MYGSNFPIVRRKEWLCRSPSRWGHDLPTALKPAGRKFPDAEVRVLPPQPARLCASISECRSKWRGIAAFHRYGFFSVCGIWQWKRHSCLLSPRAFIWCLVFECASEPSSGWRRPSLSRFALDGCNTKSTGTAGGLQFSFRHFYLGAAYLTVSSTFPT
jgi:hypothetical protein